MLNGPNNPEPSETDRLLRQAIAERRLVAFSYKHKPRIAEPHDYGIQQGVIRLLVFQVGGLSDGPLPNWRLIDVESISELSLKDRKFRGGRPTPSGKHQKWDKLFARVKSNTN